MEGTVPPSSRNRRDNRSRRSRLLRCVIITTLVLLIMLGLAILIAWLVVRPTSLDYTVEDASIRNYNLTSDGKLNSTFHLRLTADNRNKKVSVFYDSMEITVSYEDQLLAAAELAPFHQPKRNATRIIADPAARDVMMLATPAKDMRMDRSSGKVELDVVVKARIRFKVGVIKSRHYTLNVYCSPVVVYFSSRNEFQRTYCDVDI